MTTLAWAINYWSVYLFGRAFDFEISYLEMAGIASVFTLVSFIPISVMGMGTRDAVLILLLAKYGVTEAQAVAFSTVCLAFIVSAALICSYSLLTPAAHIQWRRAMDEGKASNG